MRAYQIGTLAILSLIMVVGFQNCGQSGMTSATSLNPSSQNSLDKDLQNMRLLIDSLNQEDLSCAQDSDCEAMPIGWRACGGPSTYIIASRMAAQHDQLVSLADLYKQKVQAQLAATNAVGTCITVLPPEPHCVQNACQR
jgi:hypothetical protein